MFLVLLQIMFVVYMILVTLLLVNMLIAMMGNTYHMVNEAQGEWLRQVRCMCMRQVCYTCMCNLFDFSHGFIVFLKAVFVVIMNLNVAIVWQWASIILVIEQTVTTEARKQQQISYSLPLQDGRRAILIKWHQTVSQPLATAAGRATSHTHQVAPDGKSTTRYHSKIAT